MTKKIEWTTEIDDFFETLLGQEENLTFSQIARLMTERFELLFTKNGCVGRAHRLKMPPRAPHKVASEPRKPRKRRPKVITMPIRVDAPIVPVEAHRRNGGELTLIQLDHGLCKWPGVDLKTNPPYRYCGKPTRDGASYCPEHYAICYHAPRKEFS